jgi:hypothetical protein
VELRVAVIVLMATACRTAPAPPQLDQRPPQPELQKYVDAAGRVGFTGRVLMGSTPVPYFGVRVVRTFASSIAAMEPVVEVHTGDGWFHLPHEAGTWDVVIVGPGFARKLLIDKTINPGRATDLGVIEVSPGFVTRGRVLDTRGRPVANAVVSLTQNFWATDHAPLAGLASGTFETTTDSEGDYSFRGVTTLDLTGSDARISAKHGRDRSFPSPVPTGNVTIDLVVEPTGIIEVTAACAADHERVIVRGNQRRDVVMFETIHNHRMVVDLPAGEYSVVVAARGCGRDKHQVRVVPDATATVVVP